jgi:hypothetical protein
LEAACTTPFIGASSSSFPSIDGKTRIEIIREDVVEEMGEDGWAASHRGLHAQHAAHVGDCSSSQPKLAIPLGQTVVEEMEHVRKMQHVRKHLASSSSSNHLASSADHEGPSRPAGRDELTARVAHTGALPSVVPVLDRRMPPPALSSRMSHASASQGTEASGSEGEVRGTSLMSQGGTQSIASALPDSLVPHSLVGRLVELQPRDDPALSSAGGKGIVDEHDERAGDVVCSGGWLYQDKPLDDPHTQRRRGSGVVGGGSGVGGAGASGPLPAAASRVLEGALRRLPDEVTPHAETH